MPKIGCGFKKSVIVAVLELQLQSISSLMTSE